MKFTIEHAQKVAAKLYGEPFARCVHHCEACDALAEDWEYNVSQVLAALKFLEDDK
tara:strand:+ start:1661 stop:1828 length:168 start_codon:yes stop_codon:yes gene_type:complete